MDFIQQVNNLFDEKYLAHALRDYYGAGCDFAFVADGRLESTDNIIIPEIYSIEPLSGVSIYKNKLICLYDESITIYETESSHGTSNYDKIKIITLDITNDYLENLMFEKRILPNYLSNYSRCIHKCALYENDIKKLIITFTYGHGVTLWNYDTLEQIIFIQTKIEPIFNNNKMFISNDKQINIMNLDTSLLEDFINVNGATCMHLTNKSLDYNNILTTSNNKEIIVWNQNEQNKYELSTKIPITFGCENIAKYGNMYIMSNNRRIKIISIDDDLVKTLFEDNVSSKQISIQDNLLTFVNMVDYGWPDPCFIRFLECKLLDLSTMKIIHTCRTDDFPVLTKRYYAYHYNNNLFVYKINNSQETTIKLFDTIIGKKIYKLLPLY